MRIKSNIDTFWGTVDCPLRNTEFRSCQCIRTKCPEETLDDDDGCVNYKRPKNCPLKTGHVIVELGKDEQ